MKLIIVSGFSGAGKTIALHSLEDRGAYCIDNLPVNLLPFVAQQMQSLAYPGCTCVAVGIDVRNTTLRELPTLLEKLQAQNIEYDIVFLRADPDVLIKRFSETRRKHPLTLSHPEWSLAEALQQETHMLNVLSRQADTLLDTSHTNVHQLRDLVRLKIKINLDEQQSMPLLIQSFGFKHGVPKDIDFVFDVRCLPNPHWERHLRSLTGLDHAVVEYLQPQTEVQQMQEDLQYFLQRWIPQFEADNRSYLSIAVGCTGGQHRSVFMAEQLAAYFRQQREGVLVRHRELS